MYDTGPVNPDVKPCPELPALGLAGLLYTPV